MNAIVEFFKANFTKEMAVILISMLPIIELRGAIPIAMSMGMTYKKSFLLSFVGSSIPAILIVYLIGYIFKLLRKINFFDRFILKISEKTLSKRDQIDKYGYFGLYLFVAIPLPGTGVWTGSLLSYLLEMNKPKAVLAVVLGNLTAGIIVTAISGGIMSLV